MLGGFLSLEFLQLKWWRIPFNKVFSATAILKKLLNSIAKRWWYMYMYMILPTQILITNYVRDSYCRWIWPGWLFRLMREELMHAFCQVYRSLLWILDDEHIYKEESSPCLSTHVSFLGCCVFLSYNSIHHHPWQKSLRLHQPKITRDCVFMNSLFYVTIPSIVFDDFFSILIIMRLRHNQKRKKHLAPHSLKFPRRFTLNRSAEGRNSKYDSRVLQKTIEDLPTLAHVLKN